MLDLAVSNLIGASDFMPRFYEPNLGSRYPISQLAGTSGRSHTILRNKRSRHCAWKSPANRNRPSQASERILKSLIRTL